MIAPSNQAALSLEPSQASELSALRAGVARRAITPPRWVPLAGYPRLINNMGTRDELTATAVVVDDGVTKLALVGLDLLYVHESMVDRVRDLVAPVEVVLCCSHTHSGPISYAHSRASRATKEYLESLVGNIVAAVREAAASAVPATLEYSLGEGDIAINRRKRMPDGTVRPGEYPEGPVDRSLQVVSILSTHGERLATLVNYACHPTAFGPENPYASADWVGAMRAIVERELGGHALFLQGASGDIIPLGSFPFPRIWQVHRSRALVKALGDRLGESVVTAVREHAEAIDGAPLRVARRDALLPSVVPVTSERPPTTYHKALLDWLKIPRIFAGAVDFAIELIFPWKFPQVVEKDGVWAMPTRVNALRLGDLAIATIAAEPFTELGMSIKERSPARHTLIVGAADGTVLYIPTAREHKLGGFEVDFPWALLKMPGNYAVNVGYVTCDSTRELLEELWADESPQ